MSIPINIHTSKGVPQNISIHVLSKAVVNFVCIIRVCVHYQGNLSIAYSTAMVTV